LRFSGDDFDLDASRVGRGTLDRVLKDALQRVVRRAVFGALRHPKSDEAVFRFRQCHVGAAGAEPRADALDRLPHATLDADRVKVVK
jgi:hypothetical protein